ncbi:MAG: AbrB/MazE/SpoVT family DNA-binding domain-containing protein [Clostridiales bacterium]|nr:AbrB/MazE/SpoVT family DNA-binding domain-containing protein [Clostridiales bacterium]
MKDELTYLETYTLQKDMRIRLPKCIIENLEIVKGESKFKIYLNNRNKQIILQLDEDDEV